MGALQFRVGAEVSGAQAAEASQAPGADVSGAQAAEAFAGVRCRGLRRTGLRCRRRPQVQAAEVSQAPGAEVSGAQAAEVSQALGAEVWCIGC